MSAVETNEEALRCAAELTFSHASTFGTVRCTKVSKHTGYHHAEAGHDGPIRWLTPQRHASEGDQ